MGRSASGRNIAFVPAFVLGLVALTLSVSAFGPGAVGPARPALGWGTASISSIVPTHGPRLSVMGVSMADPRPGPLPDVSNGTIPASPTMGWNSWNQFGCDGLDETLVRETADAMAGSGLLSAGYDTLTLDDCWSAVARDSSGNLTNDPGKFPSGMAAIGDYVHARGLKYGIYASIGTATCTGHTAGSLDHEHQDVATFASWGVDYIKADRCNASGLTMKDIYARWRDAIAASGRPIVLSASDNGAVQEPWAWGPVTAHQWRMSGDIADNWATMISIFDQNAAHAAATAPGGFNDPDMLEVGNGGMTETEYHTHLGLWALMSAPLISGNDVRGISPAILAILTNPEVIAVDQDPLGFQAIKASDNGAGQQVWFKPIAGSGRRAVGLLNRGNAASTMQVDWATIGLASGNAIVRDLWANADRGTFSNSYNVSVPGHGVALLRIVGTDPVLTEGLLSHRAWIYMANEWGPVERNMSNGGRASGDGRPLMLNGVEYANGFGARAPSAIEFRANGSCTAFTADIGVDDEVGDFGSVIFQVWGDGGKLYESGVMIGTTATTSINVSIAGRRSLRLQIVAVDSTGDDSGDWANVRVMCPTTPNAPPSASFLASAPWVRPGSPVTFDAGASTDSDGTIVAYWWDLGDGSADSGPIAHHAYARSGRFTVVLTVVDDRGAFDTAVLGMAVSLPPIASFSVSPPAAAPGAPIRFDASNSADPDGVIVLFAWDFGDGGQADGVAVTHAYLRQGNFTVHLSVTDDLGATDGMEDTIKIGNVPPSILSTSPEATLVLAVSERRTFAVVASDSDGDSLTFSWYLNGLWVSSASSSYPFVGMVTGAYTLRVEVSDGSAAVGFVWHIDVRAKTAVALPSAEFPASLAAMGVLTTVVIITRIVHAVRSRRRG